MHKHTCKGSREIWLTYEYRSREISVLFMEVSSGFSFRVAAVTMGQALVDTKRLSVVSSLDAQFKDEPNLFLGFGQAADMGREQVESPTDMDAPKWFQRLPENEDSEVEHSLNQERKHNRYN